MKKPLKVMSTATMAAVLASTAIVPVAAQAAVNEASEADFVIFDKGNGEHVTLSVEEYGVALFQNKLKEEAIKELTFVEADNGQHYDLSDYGVALFKNKGDAKEAFASLDPIELDKVKEGIVKDGFVVAKEDEQPEDRLNETFFYNVA